MRQTRYETQGNKIPTENDPIAWTIDITVEQSVNADENQNV